VVLVLARSCVLRRDRFSGWRGCLAWQPPPGPGQPTRAWAHRPSRLFLRDPALGNWPIWKHTACRAVACLLLIHGGSWIRLAALRVSAFGWRLSLPGGGMNGVFAKLSIPGVARRAGHLQRAAAAPMPAFQRWPPPMGKGLARRGCPLGNPPGHPRGNRTAFSASPAPRPARIAPCNLSLEASRRRSCSARWCHRR